MDLNSLRTLDIYLQGSWLLNVLHSAVRGEAFTNNSGSINIDSTVQPCNLIKWAGPDGTQLPGICSNAPGYFCLAMPLPNHALNLCFWMLVTR